QELRAKLWANDTFVDFDHSLNTAVNKIREVLNDSASSPRFIATVARRGYRFVAPVEPVTAPGANAPLKSLHPELEVPLPNRAVTRALFILVQLMYLTFYRSALFRWSQIDRITDTFLPGWASFAVIVVVIVPAGIGIPLRCYLISATIFDYRRLGEKFQRM